MDYYDCISQISVTWLQYCICRQRNNLSILTIDPCTKSDTTNFYFWMSVEYGFEIKHFSLFSSYVLQSLHRHFTQCATGNILGLWKQACCHCKQSFLFIFGGRARGYELTWPHNKNDLNSLPCMVSMHGGLDGIWPLLFLSEYSTIHFQMSVDAVNSWC